MDDALDERLNFNVEDIEKLSDLVITKEDGLVRLVGTYTLRYEHYNFASLNQPQWSTSLFCLERNIATGLLTNRSYGLVLRAPWQQTLFSKDNSETFPSIRGVQRRGNYVHVMGEYEGQDFYQVLGEGGKTESCERMGRYSDASKTVDCMLRGFRISRLRHPFMECRWESLAEYALGYNPLPTGMTSESVANLSRVLLYTEMLVMLRKENQAENDRTFEDASSRIVMYQTVSDIPGIMRRAHLIPLPTVDRQYLEASSERSLRQMALWLGGNAVINVEQRCEPRKYRCPRVIGVRGTPCRIDKD